ncbi:hypothetical protein ACF07Q_00525 [Nocardiopsis dassonvillei]|uniref:hypothetical protein n=1 Tax=Nocardiopsis dassonvillei TaxID=2014 RepID=UPI0036FA46F9
MGSPSPSITSAVVPEHHVDDAYLFQGTWVAHYKRKNGKWEHTYAANEAQHVSRVWPQLAHTVGRKAHRAVFEHKEELWFFHNGSKKITLYNLRDKKVTTVDTAAKIVLPDTFKDKPITAAAKTSSDVVYLFSGSEYFAYRLSNDATLATGALDTPKPVDSGYRDPKTGKAYLCSGDKLVPVTAGNDHELTPGTSASLAGTWPKPPLGRPHLVLYSATKSGFASGRVSATYTDIDASTENAPSANTKTTVKFQYVTKDSSKQWNVKRVLLTADGRHLLCLASKVLASIDVTRIGDEEYEPYAVAIPGKEIWSNDEAGMAFSLDGKSLWVYGRPNDGDLHPFQADVSDPAIPWIRGSVNSLTKGVASFYGVSSGWAKKHEYAYFGTQTLGMMRVSREKLDEVKFFRKGANLRVLGYGDGGATLYLSRISKMKDDTLMIHLESYDTQACEVTQIGEFKFILGQNCIHFSSFLSNGEKMCVLRPPLVPGGNYFYEAWRHGEKNPYVSAEIPVRSGWYQEDWGSLTAMDPNGNFVYYLYDENNKSKIGVISVESGYRVAQIDTGEEIDDRDLALGWTWSRPSA